MSSRIPSDEELSLIAETFSYEPETGVFRWKRKCSPHSSIGGIAGGNWSNKAGKSYRMLTLLGRKYHAHCIAVFIMTGTWPTGEVDHADCDGLNNKWLNLREGTKSQNQANTRRRKDNSSGFKGVNFHKSHKKFVARIQFNGRRISLGLFSNPSEAHAAYVEASQKLFRQFSRSN